MGRMQNSGQACIAAKRLIVTEDIYEPFVEGLKQAFATFSPGDPSRPVDDAGPAVERAGGQGPARADPGRHRQGRDRRHRRQAAPTYPGAFVEPTILTDVTPEMRAYSRGALRPGRRRLQGARTRTRRSSWPTTATYGLGAAVFSSDLDKARSVADRLEAGMVFVNQPTGSSAELPFGGVKRSGYGRELSELGMFEFANRRLARVLPAKKADKPQAG